MFFSTSVSNISTLSGCEDPTLCETRNIKVRNLKCVLCNFFIELKLKFCVFLISGRRTLFNRQLPVKIFQQFEMQVQVSYTKYVQFGKKLPTSKHILNINKIAKIKKKRK